MPGVARPGGVGGCGVRTVKSVFPESRTFERQVRSRETKDKGEIFGPVKIKVRIGAPAAGAIGLKKLSSLCPHFNGSRSSIQRITFGSGYFRSSSESTQVSTRYLAGRSPGQNPPDPARFRDPLQTGDQTGKTWTGTPGARSVREVPEPTACVNHFAGQ